LRALAAAVVLVVSSACETTRPADLHPDAVALFVLLVAGRDEARLLAVHPHREWGEPAPDITATLEGPGWTASFADTRELSACPIGSESRPRPARCLRAVLPATIRPGGAYGLRGTAPLGSFTGEMTMPAPPVLLEPADSLRLAVPEGHSSVWIPVRYRIGSDIGTLMADRLDYFEILEDGSEVRIEPLYHLLVPIDRAAEADSVWMGGCFSDTNPIGFSLRLLGIGWHYTDFTQLRVDYSDLWLPPWPDFGIEGEGVYGYFDGLTPSRSARIVVVPPQTGCARP